MEVTNINFSENFFSLNTPLKHVNMNKTLNPFIDISLKNYSLNIIISFFYLRKKEVIINYINNFLIINISYYLPKSDDIREVKRIFYYKDLDFCKSSSIVFKEMISLKIPFLIK